MVTGGAVSPSGDVTGTFAYVTGYTGFNNAVPDEQEGYFFPFLLKKAGTTMTFKKNGSVGKENIPYEEANVFRVSRGDTFEILVDGESVVVLNFENAVFSAETGK